VNEESSCCVCQAETDCPFKAHAFVRGFNLGTAFALSEVGTSELLRGLFCLRHCHELQEHAAWARRNVGAEPPQEPEPVVTP
jgi:hypothetical protein